MRQVMVREKRRKAKAKERTSTETRAAVVVSHVTGSPTDIIATRIAALVGRTVTRVRCADQVKVQAPILARWKWIPKTRSDQGNLWYVGQSSLDIHGTREVGEGNSSLIFASVAEEHVQTGNTWVAAAATCLGAPAECDW